MAIVNQRTQRLVGPVAGDGLSHEQRRTSLRVAQHGAIPDDPMVRRSGGSSGR
jgi:hypothetical protein